MFDLTVFSGAISEMNLTSELQKYGISSNVRRFGASAEPELLDYLDLIKVSDTMPVSPEGVAENQGRPLLFFVDESNLATEPSDQALNLTKLRRTLACRGDRAYLARILPGMLKVVPVGLDDRMPAWKEYRAGTGEAQTFFSRLVLGQYDGQGEPASSDQLFKEMFDLLNEGANRLADKLGQSDVLSLIGRALFFRFLQDRRIVSERDRKAIAPNADSLNACFNNPENSAATCDWLDRTFNGHFLTLSKNGGFEFFVEAGKSTRSEVFRVLGSILRGDEAVGAADYQGKFKWSDFQFAHIPVGLLSQVYEKFLWTWEKRKAKETSVHYTPRNIAATLVEEAFDKLPNAHEARVLDPACGAGVFLVLAFRRLYRELWKVSGQRPDTKAIRAILDKQLTGLDISDSALKLSALSLYLTAIELDPKPVPPEKLRFKDLQNAVLFNTRPNNSPDKDVTIGSLGKHLSAKFDSKFDLILSNPPWTSLLKSEKGKEVAAEFTNLSQEIIRKKGEDSLAAEYQNPDNAPDLPFVWKSMEWCKPGGRIAMALPARILFKQEAVPVRARHTMFQLLEVTGIINGSNLSDTKVWPEMQQPFMLMFARNRRPKPSHIVRFITPHYDSVLNKTGEMRIDSKSAQPVELSAADEAPWIWKALAIGTSLDIDVVRKLSGAGGRSLLDYWETDLGLKSGDGYSIKPTGPQRDASHLHGLPNLTSEAPFDFKVEPDQLEKFQLPTASRPRKRDLYRAPLVLAKESPGAKRENGWALLSNVDVAFSESFHGYSGADHSEGNLLVRYLHLFIHSLLWMHYALLTSPKLGAERRKVYKTDLDDFPFVPLGDLSSVQRREINLLSKRLERADKTVFPEIDKFFGSIYGLDKFDLEVIQDTFDVCMPYKESRDRACQSPSNSERRTFCKRLESVLSPFFQVLGKQPEVTLSEPNGETDFSNPFSILKIGVRGQMASTSIDNVERKVQQLATETGATQIIQETERGLAIGILNQYRYWTPSRARLLSAEILRSHTAVFEEA